MIRVVNCFGYVNGISGKVVSCFEYVNRVPDWRVVFLKKFMPLIQL
jgi:hypothetical protein